MQSNQIISLKQFENPAQDQSSYAQTLDGSQSQFRSLSQGFQDLVTDSISQPDEDETSFPDWLKVSVFFGIGFLVYKYFKRSF